MFVFYLRYIFFPRLDVMMFCLWFFSIMLMYILDLIEFCGLWKIKSLSPKPSKPTYLITLPGLYYILDYWIFWTISSFSVYLKLNFYHFNILSYINGKKRNNVTKYAWAFSFPYWGILKKNILSNSILPSDMNKKSPLIFSKIYRSKLFKNLLE